MGERDASTDPRQAISRFGPWLVVAFDAPHSVASWAIVGGGLGVARAVVWRHVEERELRPPVNAAQWLNAKMREAALEGVGLLTGCNLDARTEAASSFGGVGARCVATVGLGNALRAGDPPGAYARIGTINALVHVDVALDDNALLEALAIATEAKTVALVEGCVRSRRTGLAATGTGTDCLVVASPRGQGLHAASPYAGKHTAVGAAIGAAVLEAVSRGAAAWRAVAGEGAVETG